MRTIRIDPSRLTALVWLAAGVAAAQTVPDGRLDYYEFATDPELVRYAEADCALVYPWDLLPTWNGDVLLRADHWVSLPGPPPSYEVPLCPDIRFYAQPSAGRGGVESLPGSGRGGSCILVGPDLVLTAGHLFQTESQCSDRVFLFDFAEHLAPGGDAAAGEQVLTEPNYVLFPAENVFYCSEAVHVGWPNEDWTLVRLDRPVADRTPLKIRRAGQVEAGTPLANVGHPDRLPLKAETGEVFFSSPTGVYSRFHVRAGSSGSTLVNRDTGRLEGIVVTGGLVYRERPGAGCWEPCLDSSCLYTTGATSVALASSWIPPLGLGIEPAGEETVLQLGPVGGPFTNSDVSYELSVPDGEPAPVPFTIAPADPSPWVATVVEAPPLGELAPGESAGLGISLGNEAYGLGPSRLEQTFLVHDETYSTNEIKRFRLVVGYDGVTVAPDEPFAGDGPGAQPGATKGYSLENHYLVPLDVRISATQPWILIDGGTGARVVTLPASGGSDVGATFQVVDSFDLPNGVHTGSILFQQLPENGEPVVRDVRFDVGRRFFRAPELPVVVGPGTTEIPIVVPSRFTLLDADLELEVGGTGKLSGTVELVSPSGTTVGLGGLWVGHWIWDDDTNPASGPGSLSDFEGEPAAGTWTLRISAAGPGTQLVTGLILRATPVGFQ